LLLTCGSIAGWELDPLVLLVVFILELDHLDVRWLLSVLEDLNELNDVLLRPLLTTGRLAMHVPVTMGTLATIGTFDVAILVLDHLVLSLGDWVLRVENWVVDGVWLPVAVVGSPLSCVVGETTWWWRWCRCWIVWHVVRVVGLARSNDGVAEVLLEWDVVGTESAAVWELDPSAIGLQQRCLMFLMVMIGLTLHDDVLVKILVAVHAGREALMKPVGS
jgi:hypothetical protein